MSYTIVRKLAVTNRPISIGKAKTPADAVREARRLAKEGGYDNVAILDDASDLHLDLNVFANKHGVR